MKIVSLGIEVILVCLIVFFAFLDVLALVTFISSLFTFNPLLIVASAIIFIGLLMICEGLYRALDYLDKRIK